MSKEPLGTKDAARLREIARILYSIAADYPKLNYPRAIMDLHAMADRIEADSEDA